MNLNISSRAISKYSISFLFLFSILSFSFYKTPEAHAVTVGPVKLEYSVNPGDTVKGEMYIKNEEATDKTFYPTLERFTEQNGEKVFTKDKNLLEDWFHTDASVPLKSGQDIKVPFVINVPKDAPPGGEFPVLWWGTNPPATTTGQQVSIQTRAGILIYINVSGNIVSSANVSQFGTVSGAGYSSGGPINFRMKIENTGNVYIKPTGELTIKSLFGTTKKVLPINEKGYQILPQSYRDIVDLEWVPSLFNIGPYKAIADVNYGNQSQGLVATKWIWVLPIKFLSISLGTIFLLIIVFTLFFRMYNRWLLKKFNQK